MINVINNAALNPSNYFTKLNGIYVNLLRSNDNANIITPNTTMFYTTVCHINFRCQKCQVDTCRSTQTQQMIWFLEEALRTIHQRF